MLILFLFGFIFYVLPITLIALFGVSLYRYIYAKKKNKIAPCTFSGGEIKERKISLIIFSILAGVFIAIFIGLIALMLTSISFM